MAQGFMVSEKPTLFERLEEQTSDPLLALIALCNADPRPGKIDVFRIELRKVELIEHRDELRPRTLDRVKPIDDDA